LETLSARHEVITANGQPEADPYALTRIRFIEAINRFDVVTADEEIRRAATLYPPGIIVRKIVSPILREIGERWAHREVGIAQEHVATNLLRNLLSSLFRLYPPDEKAEAIVFATTNGERHEFGILISALIAATRGWRVIYLGTDLPATEIAHTSRQVRARILALSVVNPHNPHTGDELSTIEATLPPSTEVWIGGAEAIRYRSIIERARWVHIIDVEELEDRLRR
ncbi:MAG: hypothetical protein EBU88_18030, partial [Acidobacteria bacterium]|nr:hypothetical protein [Acidobacteriota bacterium]